jgi:phenylalanine-4-hydroxylase
MLADDVSRLFATVLSRCLVYTLTVDSQNAANYLARLNIDNNYAWLTLFERQPLLIEKWCVERKLDKLNQLYVVCQNIINGQDETDELKSLLSVEPQLVDIIGVFFASLLNKALLNKQINLTKYTQMQQTVTEFINLCRLAKGTNFQLQCQSLVINLQK